MKILSRKKIQCCLCSKEIIEKYSHNAEPIQKGRCCTDCNIDKVIPERIRILVDDIEKGTKDL